MTWVDILTRGRHIDRRRGVLMGADQREVGCVGVSTGAGVSTGGGVYQQEAGHINGGGHIARGRYINKGRAYQQGTGVSIAE